MIEEVNMLLLDYVYEKCCWQQATWIEVEQNYW